MSTTVFRRQALAGAASPEQLDQVMRAALPLQWAALVALLLAVTAAVVWSAVTTVPVTVTGRGGYLPLGGLLPVETPVTGRVSPTPSLRIGNRVRAGQVLAVVKTPSPLGATGGESYAVVTPRAGVVVEVSPVADTYVGAGKELAVVEPADRPLVVYAFVGTQQASELAPGVPTQVEFGGGLSDRFGYAEGTVATVSRYPIPLDQVSALVADPSVAAALSGLGPIKEVTVALEPSPSPSGLTWASGTGPAARVPAGLPVSVRFMLGSHHPISDVL